VADLTHVVSADPAPSKLVNVTINTDVAWSGGAAPVELDDPSDLGGSLGSDVAQIFLRTNGDVDATELAGDMLVGSIESTQHDVTLHSPRRIIDANGQTGIDVTGVNITMTAGTAGVQGGIGTPADFLEINVDVTNSHTGVL